MRALIWETELSERSSRTSSRTVTVPVRRLGGSRSFLYKDFSTVIVLDASTNAASSRTHLTICARAQVPNVSIPFRIMQTASSGAPSLLPAVWRERVGGPGW